MASVLIIGAYGFIGAEVTRSLLGDGHTVHVLGRNDRLLDALGAETVWQRDLRQMTRPEDWATVLAGVDVVVNASGVLQDGPKDDVERVQRYAIAAMAKAAANAGIARIVQISAVGADANADTPFMASKGVADQLLLDGPTDAIILRPGLVLGRSVYGGTALLRMLAAVPVFQPIAHGDAQIQTVAMEDVVMAVRHSVNGDLPVGQFYDLVSEEAVPLRRLIFALRNWLGFRPAWCEIRVNDRIAGLASWGADVLGQLGWRSPLRSSAMVALRNGISGDPAAWRAAGMPACCSLSETLSTNCATLQDRLHARLTLAAPVVIAVLSVFWLLSGAIGILSFDEASRILIYRGFSDELAHGCVGAGIAADLLLGLCVLIRNWARPAMLCMVAVCLGYLTAGSIWTPDLWDDPLGPFVKVLPAAMLAAVGSIMIEDR